MGLLSGIYSETRLSGKGASHAADRPRLAKITGCLHAVGGATASRARARASGPTCVTATAAIATMTAMAANTAVVLQAFWISGIARIAMAAPARPAACDKPKPVARALVGNTSEMKICDALPDS